MADAVAKQQLTWCQ